MRLYWLSFSHLWGGKLEAIFSFSSIFWGWNFGKNPSFLPQAKKFNSARRYRADHSKCKILQNQILSGPNVVTASWPLYDFSILLIIWSSWETKLFFFFVLFLKIIVVGRLRSPLSLLRLLRDFLTLICDPALHSGLSDQIWLLKLFYNQSYLFSNDAHKLLNYFCLLKKMLWNKQKAVLTFTLQLWRSISQFQFCFISKLRVS